MKSKKTKQIHILVTPEEHELLMRSAEKVGLTLSQYIVIVALNFELEIKVRPIDVVFEEPK